ncbi:hypothetical protein FQN50_002875 [Emmonsiellopsis sp. PD_5]|nr:hypothetical protein FQN50_002875 [Emmonsiellopsis sp. PD_5]
MNPFPSLSSLPAELSDLIFEQLVLIEQFERAICLRLVCKWFNLKTTRAILTTGIIHNLHLARYTDTRHDFWILNQLQHEILLASPDPNQTGKNRLLCALRQLVNHLVAIRPINDSNPPSTDHTRHYHYAALLSEAVLAWHGARLTLWALRGRDTLSNFLLAMSFDHQHHPLSAAAYIGDIDLVTSLIIDQGVNCNTPTNLLPTPLWLAAFRGHEQIVSFLLETGRATPNPQNEYDLDRYLEYSPRGVHGRWEFNFGENLRLETPLQAACYAGRRGVVDILLQPKYGIQLRGAHYYAALMWALRGNQPEIARRLIDEGSISGYRSGNSQVRQRDRPFWNVALVKACEAGAEDVIELILDHGDGGSLVNANKSDVQGTPCIAMAAARGCEKTVRILLDRGANPDPFHGKVTALSLAAKHGRLEMVQLLIARGASPRYCSPLVAAAAGGDERVVRFLIESGALGGGEAGKGGPGEEEDATKVGQAGGPFGCCCE